MTYEFRTTSSLHYIGSAFLSMLVIGFLVINITGTLSKLSALIFSLTTVFVAWFIGSRSSRGKIRIEIKDELIVFQYLSKALINFQKDMTIEMKDIVSWRFRPDRNFDMFKITLIDGKILRFEKISSWEKDSDEFLKFKRKFEMLVDQENMIRIRNQKPVIVDKEVEFFKGKFAKAMYYFSIVALIGTVIIVVLTWETGKSHP